MPKKVKVKKAKKEEKEDKEFAEFFKKHGQDVKKKDMSKIERAPVNRRRNILIFTFTILILILAVSLLGFFFFIRENKFTGEGVNLEINLTERVSSGDEISLDVLITNYEKVDLKLSELTIRWPEGFKFSSSQPTASNEFNNAWDLGTIDSGQETRVTIRGQLVGEVDSSKIFLATLNYVPSNFNSEFQELATKEVTIASSTVELKIDSPDGAVNEQVIQFKITYQNTSAETLSKVRLRMTYPDGFTYQSAEPGPRTGSNNIWQDDTLADNEEKEVVINGQIKGEAGSMKEIKAEIGIIKPDGTFSLQTESYFLFTILEPTSDLELTINGDYEDSVIGWGDDLDIKIKFKNSGSIILNDIELGFFCDPTVEELLDISTMEDEHSTEVSEGGFKWNSSQIEELTEVRPGDEIEKSWQIRTKAYNDLEIEESNSNFKISCYAVAVTTSLTDTGSSYRQESNQIVNKFASEATFNVEGRYYDDDLDKVGEGPLPPEVGEQTTYKVYWYIANTTNILDDLVVITTLPAGATWEGNKTISQGTLSYDQETKVVTWQIDQLSTHLGKIKPEAIASFEVSITPESKDIGKLMVITESSQLLAVDSFTDQNIEITEGLVDTNLDSDVGAQGKGVVVKASSSPENSNNNQNINS